MIWCISASSIEAKKVATVGQRMAVVDPGGECAFLVGIKLTEQSTTVGRRVELGGRVTGVEWEFRVAAGRKVETKELQLCRGMEVDETRRRRVLKKRFYGSRGTKEE